MALSKSRDLRELCYPFIFERKPTCDYEILTDELCCQIGAVLAQLPELFSDVQADLQALQPLSTTSMVRFAARMASSRRTSTGSNRAMTITGRPVVIG